MTKYVRDHVQAPVPGRYFQDRLSAGWTLRAIEWEKEDTAEQPAAATRWSEPADEPVPYGLQVESNSLNLKQNPQEIAVLLTILEMVVADEGVPLIADALNQRGYTTRHGARWTSPAVFHLLPRVIELGPQLLQTDDWQKRRTSLNLQV
jgi:Recombinase